MAKPGYHYPDLSLVSIVGFVKLNHMQISLSYVRMNCTSMPQILKSNQICKCTGVSPKRITQISFSRFIRRILFSSPSQLAFPYHNSKQMHVYNISTSTPYEVIFRTYVCGLRTLSRSTRRQYQSYLPANTSHESASASLHRL